MGGGLAGRGAGGVERAGVLEGVRGGAPAEAGVRDHAAVGEGRKTGGVVMTALGNRS